MAVSVFDLFKIGIGPSSSHTVGPMRAARMFVARLQHDGLLDAHRARAGRAVRLARRHRQGPRQRQGGAARAWPGTSPTRSTSTPCRALLRRHARAARASTLLRRARRSRSTSATDLVFHRRETLPFHANGMRFTAFDADGAELASRVYYSVGGGFVVSDEVAADGTQQKAIAPDTTVLPLPVPQRRRAAASCTREHGCSIAEVMRRNERHWRTDAEIDAGLLKIWQVMQDCVRARLRAPKACCPAASRSSAARPALYRAADRRTPKPRCATR